MKQLRRILIVEDEPSLRLVAQVALEKVGGFEVLPCESGEEALARYSEFSPDLVLLDVMMPVLDGPTTLTCLQGIHGSELVPVIFLTAKVQRKELDELMTLGAIGVLGKPFDPMQLSEQVRKLWHASLVNDQDGTTEISGRPPECAGGV